MVISAKVTTRPVHQLRCDAQLLTYPPFLAVVFAPILAFTFDFADLVTAATTPVAKVNE